MRPIFVLHCITGMQQSYIIFVSASFLQGNALLQWLRRYATHYDDVFVYWHECAFTTNELPEYDAVLVLNTPSALIKTKCFPEMTLAFMMEPGVYAEHPFMFKQLDQYAAVYAPVPHSQNTIASHGYMGWLLPQDYHALSALAVPEKTKLISCIASSLQMLPGHRLRMQFVEALRQSFPEMDFFGRGFHFIPDKSEGLLPYKYSIAIENTSAPHYFTEKINDCFLTYTVPIYFGCTNIGTYFPEQSYISININEPENAVATIKAILQHDNWQERLPALHEARELVLNRYQTLAGAAAILRHIQPSVKKTVTLKPVPPTLQRRLKNFLQHLRAKK
ncbi:MAG: hypothetical protein JST86_02080 [Bacteroidetes bacterium]|nr:hypothetical protein [Bacteroidota bacterium]